MVKFMKVCGVQDCQEAAMISRYADATGVVVACDSKREVDIPVARDIISKTKIPVYLVSTSNDTDIWAQLIMETNARHVQLHTDGIDPDTVDELHEEYKVMVMKAFKVPRQSADPVYDAELLKEEIERYNVHRVLLDTGSGTGIVHDIRVSSIIAQDMNIILAGGLDPNNAAGIVSSVAPYGVDVSSGVEHGNRKKEELVSAFCKAIGKINNGKVIR